MKTVFFSHGDKGGVGKSAVASVAADWLLDSGVSAAILETDGGIPDVAARFKGHMKSSHFKLGKAGTSSNAAQIISAWLEANPHDYIVINLPANASEMLDDSADVLLEVFEALGYEAKAAWSLGKSAASTEALARSMDRGLLGRLKPENRLVLYPVFQGDKSTFPAIPADSRSAVMPVLEPAVVRDAVLKAEKPFSALKDGPDLNVHGKIVLMRWVTAARDALRPLFPELP